MSFRVYVLYVMYNSMPFEWDAGKSRSNQKKHAGIDSETASRVFADLSFLLRKDRRAALARDRCRAEGCVARGACIS
jgi:uncharacterized DUF497 family protein